MCANLIPILIGSRLVSPPQTLQRAWTCALDMNDAAIGFTEPPERMDAKHETEKSKLEKDPIKDDDIGNPES